MGRVVIFVLALGIAVAVAGCGGAAHLAGRGKPHRQTGRPGYVTGYAGGCGPAHIDFRPVRVTAARGGKVVAIQTVRSASHIGSYRMKLAPGRYLISAPRSGLSPQILTVRPGRTVTADFKGTCS